MRTRLLSVGLATTILAAVGIAVWGAMDKQERQIPTGAASVRHIENLGVTLDVDKPTFKQATVKLRVTDGHAAPVDCQMTLDMVPVFDEGMAARLRSSTCPPPLKVGQATLS